jgi:hypothetical protein
MVLHLRRDGNAARGTAGAGLSIHDVYWSLERLVSEGRELAEADVAMRYVPPHTVQLPRLVTQPPSVHIRRVVVQQTHLLAAPGWWGFHA